MVMYLKKLKMLYYHNQFKMSKKSITSRYSVSKVTPYTNKKDLIFAPYLVADTTISDEIKAELIRQDREKKLKRINKDRLNEHDKL